MRDVPRESLGHHLGFGKDKQEGRDELDKTLARKLESFLRLSVLLNPCTKQDMHDMCTNFKMVIPQPTNLRILKNGDRTTLRPALTTGGVEPIDPRPSPIMAVNLHQDHATHLPRRNA